MTIELITKGKIADYIKDNSDAYAYFVMWLKESKYRDRPRHLDADTPDGTIMISGQLGASNYVIKYKVNIWHKTAYIIFFGTRKEEIVYYENETKKLIAEYPDTEFITTSETIIVSVKPPNISEKSPAFSKTIVPKGEHEEFIFPDHINNDLPYQTKEEYEKNLDRAITIFNAQPGTNEFEELTTLLSLIKGYESAIFKFPMFNMLTALKLRMQDFQLKPNDLIYAFGNRKEVDLFLSGEKIPPNLILKKVYNMMGLKILADRDDFIPS
ncbi:antitoxin component HigA of HigAB toxin-antitoxin module [Mucilaginibacter gracilis]|uniref:Antitoxin component HigA of HigAB toxin-antitoxin module n=1 Tax=Mucilaginibacter gracilis TaxID=423350 RepID=A0A495J973_9SPHI|nr:hypothetical protein [Mucilaginibacter gracilis]RKR85028.1 antitoxin component HigA of HigAB toxin-antitoxin module [Mucilaginibacter gracilis]